MAFIPVPVHDDFNNAIPADSGRTLLQLCLAKGSSSIRYSYGSTYSKDNSMRLRKKDMLTIEAPFCQHAISLKGGKKTSLLETLELN